MCQIIDSLSIRILGQELGCQNDGVKKVSTRREDSVEIIDNIICNYDGPNQTKCMFRPYYMR